MEGHRLMLFEKAKRAGWLVGLMTLLVLGAAPTAVAAPDKPSTAHQLEVDVTYSSSLSNGGHEWLRLPQSMNSGDELTFATETDGSIRYCLVPDIDDYEQLDAEERCRSYEESYEYVDVEYGKYRRTMKWSEDSGQGFLLVVEEEYDPTVYSIVIEEIKPYEPDLDIPESGDPDSDSGEEDEPGSVAQPTLTAAPSGRTSRRRATFEFHSNHPGGRLQCKLTGQRVPRALKHWRRCTSPKHYTALNLGKKVFWLRELDDGVSSPAVRRRWTVAKTPIRVAANSRSAAMRIRCSRRRKPCRVVVVIQAGKYTFARGRYSIPAGKRGFAKLGLTKAGRRKLGNSKRARARAVFVDVRTRQRKTHPVVLVARERS